MRGKRWGRWRTAAGSRAVGHASDCQKLLRSRFKLIWVLLGMGWSRVGRGSCRGGSGWHGFFWWPLGGDSGLTRSGNIVVRGFYEETSQILVPLFQVYPIRWFHSVYTNTESLSWSFSIPVKTGSSKTVHTKICELWIESIWHFLHFLYLTCPCLDYKSTVTPGEPSGTVACNLKWSQSEMQLELNSLLYSLFSFKIWIQELKCT